MNVKIFGAILVILACGGMGFSIAAAYRMEEKALQQFISALEYMSCDLQYRMTSLPELCRQTSSQVKGMVGEVLMRLANELDRQISPDAESCMHAAVQAVPHLPDSVRDNFLMLGQTLGRFHLTGQLSGLESVQQLCRRDLEGLRANRDVRIRSYETLGICAGVALVIIFI